MWPKSRQSRAVDFMVIGSSAAIDSRYSWVEFGPTYAMIEGPDSKATLVEPTFNQMIN